MDKMLFQGIREWDTTKMKRAVLGGAMVNKEVMGMGTPLTYATHCGNFDTIATLVSLGADVNQRVGDDPPLVFAIKMAKIELAWKMLLNFDINVRIIDRYGWSPIMWAIVAKQPQIVHLIVAKANGYNVLLKN